MGPGYRLTLVGARTVTLTQAQLLSLPQQAVELPIACVEGWSVAARWTGVRLADLARLAGMTEPAGAQVDSIQRVGAFQVGGAVRGPGGRPAGAAGRHGSTVT